MLSRTHSPQKVLPITHNKTHSHSTSNITCLSSPLLSSFQNKKEKSSTLFCFSLYNQPMENYSFMTFTSYPESSESLVFRHVSRPILACFGHRPIWHNFGRIGPIRCESKPSQRESVKKKAQTRGQPRRTPLWHPPSRINAS